MENDRDIANDPPRTPPRDLQTTNNTTPKASVHIQRIESSLAVMNPPPPKKEPSSQVQIPETSSKRVQQQRGSSSPKAAAVNGSNQLAPKSTPEPELSKMDWAAFEDRYQQKLKDVSKEEESLMVEFNQLYASFSLWVSAAADNDHSRGLKRLKTRERFVQLAEQELEERKRHYTQVVEAFKRALDMLK